MLDLTLLVNNVLEACVLHNTCISEDDGDIPIEPQQPNAAENFDDIFAGDGHETSRSTIETTYATATKHLINEFKEHSSIFFLLLFCL